MPEDRAENLLDLRDLPPVGEVLDSISAAAEKAGVPPLLVMAWIREGLEEARLAIRQRACSAQPDRESPRGRDAWRTSISRWVLDRIGEQIESGPRRVINATGVLIHTNLGRAPLPAAAVAALEEAASGYTNLEIDLSKGKRCSRLDPIRRLLPLLTGAESGIAVHNNAAAVYLCLTALASGREVLVSRGHLVEIGGSFRLPEIMAASGAKLVEVGATNRTRISDYERAITPETALVLKVHPSNFRITGFTEEVSTRALSALAGEHGVPFLYDTGSGALRRHGELAFDEPTVEDALEEGADIVCFSGDKLLGGPQAGILVGKKLLIERLAKHPVARVVRLDKASLAALAASLEAWLDPNRVRARIPLLALLSRTAGELDATAETLKAALSGVLPADWQLEVIPALCEVGGGSLPGLELPSRAVALHHPRWSPDALAKAFRLARPSVVGRIAEDRFLLDVRALLDGDVERLVTACRSLGSAQAGGA